MLSKTQRQAQIVAELHANPMVRVAELARAFAVTTETVRRDIAALQDRGLVHRVHGGATAGAHLRAQLAGAQVPEDAEHAQLADLVLAEVQDGDTLMLEAGGMAPALARQLATRRNDLVVITNGVVVAQQLARNGTHRVQLAPGTFVPAQQATHGTETVAYLETFTVGVALVAADGLTPEGAQTARAETGAVQHSMLARARRAIVLVEAGDLGRTGFQTFAPLAAIDQVIAGAAPGEKLGRALRDHAVGLRAPGARQDTAPVGLAPEDRPVLRADGCADHRTAT